MKRFILTERQEKMLKEYFFYNDNSDDNLEEPPSEVTIKIGDKTNKSDFNDDEYTYYCVPQIKDENDFHSWEEDICFPFFILDDGELVIEERGTTHEDYDNYDWIVCGRVWDKDIVDSKLCENPIVITFAASYERNKKLYDLAINQICDKMNYDKKLVFISFDDFDTPKKLINKSNNNGGWRKKLGKLTPAEYHYYRYLDENKENEISSKFIQDRIKNTYDKIQDGYYWDDNKGEYVDIDKPDTRIRGMRYKAIQKYADEKPNQVNMFWLDDEEKQNDEFIKNNQNTELFILDDKYKSLNDLYDGVKSGELLIHSRRMVGRETQDYIYPEAGECVQQAYSADYAEVNREIEELVFASDDFSWAKDTRNGVYFVKSDNFVKSLSSEVIMYPNGQIERCYDIPATVEDGDWFSYDEAEVVGILRLKRNFKKKKDI